MSDIRWDLLNPVDTGAQVQQGFATGMAMVKQVQTRNALRHYLANPDNEQAYSALAYYDPDAAATIQRQQMLRRKEMIDMQDRERQTALGDLYNADPAAARTAAIGAGDFDLAKTFQGLDETQRKAAAARAEAAGPLAYQAAKLPYEQRRQFIDANRDILKAGGWNDTEIDGFDPQDASLAGLIGNAQKVSELIAADKPQYLPLQQGGSVARVGGGQPTTLVVAPNPGDQPTGAPVTGGGGGPGIIQRNNPGALRKPGSLEFQSFKTPQEGIAAQEALLGRYMQGGTNSVSAIIEKYAPRKSRGGDNTDAQVDNYIRYAAQRIGVNPQDALSPATLPKLAAAMREFETGRRPKGITGATASTGKEAIRAAAHRAIDAGADPIAVAARASAQGVSL